MRRITIVVTLAVALGACAAVATASRATTAVPTTGVKTLASLLTKAGLAGTLEENGAFTVFAPTDAAFAKVPATLAALAKIKAKLRAVPLYHVVKGKLTAAQAMKLHSAKTVEGKSLAIRVSGGKVIVGGATVVTPNVTASNGLIT